LQVASTTSRCPPTCRRTSTCAGRTASSTPSATPGPIFGSPLRCRRGAIVERDGFVFCDLLEPSWDWMRVQATMRSTFQARQGTSTAALGTTSSRSTASLETHSVSGTSYRALAIARGSTSGTSRLRNRRNPLLRIERSLSCRECSASESRSRASGEPGPRLRISTDACRAALRMRAFSVLEHHGSAGG
jgi:hypothetical protein